MLRKTRIALGAVMITLVTLLFLNVSWRLNLWINWVAKIQLLPAVLALNFIVIGLLVAVTLVFGRIYCSIVCPLGVMQDFFSWIGGKIWKNRFHRTKEHKWLRYSLLGIFVVCLIVGFAPATTLLAPYSAYGRIINSLFRPLYDMLVNALASMETDTYYFSEVEIWMRSVTTFVVAIITLIILALIALRHGRAYCNTICPVGTALSFFARFSFFKIRFNKDKCKSCGLCEKNCRASAIDFRSGDVDYSRCVVCGDCLDKCKFDALHFSLPKGKKNETAEQPSSPTDAGRRTFLATAGMLTATAAMAQTKMKVDGGLAVIEDKQSPERKTRITPPGSISHSNMSRHCTACQLCVSACPNDVLRPATRLGNFMQPEMSFERGYCRPECSRCSEVCPTGAIRKITPADKTAIHVGHAVWIGKNCLPLTDGVSCGNCARHCPTGAIQMIEYEGVQVPAVDTNKCIGCGACENLCPARPFSAIYVEGNEQHVIN